MEATELWNKTLHAAIKLPFVGIDRNEFLTKELRLYCTPEQIELALGDSPVKVLSKRQIDRIANGCISYHATIVCATSALSGLPGGWFMAATVPADIAQFYGHVLALIQKLLYLYGWADLQDEKGKLSDETANTMTLFVGVMMGSREAVQGVNALAKAVAEQAVKRIPRIALTRYGFYNMAKQVGRWIGIKLTKETFAKGVGKAIPLVGAPVSAALTYWTFKPMAVRLKRQLDNNLKN